MTLIRTIIADMEERQKREGIRDRELAYDIRIARARADSARERNDIPVAEVLEEYAHALQRVLLKEAKFRLVGD